MAPAPAPGLELADLSEVELVEALRAAEEEKCRLEALQVELTARLDEVVRRRHDAAGVRPEKQGAGVASQVALARRESPNRGARHLGLAKILVAELPHTLAAMRAGWCTEWRATLVARETACLSLEDRRRVDAELMADPATAEGWGDRRLVAAARARAYELDPHAALKRSRRAEGERHVSLRPAPDTMTWLTALLPVAQGVSVYAALTRTADQARAAGDERSRGQVMADALVTSLTSSQHPEPAPVPGQVPVAVNLTVSDATLFGGGHAPGWIAGYGPVPAGVACDLVASALAEAQATLRRLYTTSAGSWSRWTPAPAPSRRRWRCSSTCATSRAAPRGATHRSGTATTSSPTTRAAPPAPPTGRGCARPATRPRKRPASPPPSTRAS